VATLIVIGKEDIVRRGLVALLRPSSGLRILGEFANAQSAASLSSQHSIDVVVFIATSLLESRDELARIRSNFANSHLFLIAHKPEREEIIDAVRLGFRGMSTLDQDIGTVAAQIRLVANGDVAFSSDHVSHIVDSIRNGIGQPATDENRDAQLEGATLTSRELEILKLVSAGYNNADIAEELVISLHTVRAHMRNIFEKLHVENRIQAATWAERTGLIDTSKTNPDTRPPERPPGPSISNLKQFQARAQNGGHFRV
jgi:DNA-binding NarL/FixJ family response regulator